MKKKHGGRRRKRITTNIISFEGDNESDEAHYDELRLDLSTQHVDCDLNPSSQVIVLFFLFIEDEFIDNIIIKNYESKICLYCYL